MSERRRQWLFRSLSVVLGCLAGFGILEAFGAIALRLVEDRRPELPAELRGRILESDRSPRMVPDPYVSYRPMPGQQSDSAHVNAFGLRGPEIDPLPGPGVYRVLLLGGSVAWGYASVSDDETVSRDLEVYLNRHRQRSPVLRNRSIEVLNGGVPGYVAWQGALAYSLYYRKLEPQLIVSLDGANEYAAAVNTGRAGVPMRFQPAPPESGRPTLLAALSTWARYRLGRLKLAEYLEHVRRPSLAERAPPSAEAVAASYREALEHLADIAAAEDAVLVPVLQPLAILPGTKPLTSFEQQLVAHHEQSVPGINAAFGENYAAIRRMFAALASERPRVYPLDATGAFADEPAIAYVDHCHLTPRGRELLAATIGDWVLEKLDDPEHGIQARR